MSDHRADVAPLIQIVDDDQVTRMLMRASLEKAGFRVAEAEDGLAALNEFEQLKPNAVLLDVMMPRLDGYDTCRAIRKLAGGEYMPVLMATGLDDIGSIRQAFDAGATDFITKPINWEMLNYRIKYMLRACEAFHDVIHKQNRIQDLAFYDQLTGLANRTMFKDGLEVALADCADEKTQLAVLFMDLDRFKPINDSLGHHAGDLLLKQVAERISTCIRGTDQFSRLKKNLSKNYISRLGGDEFTLMLPRLKDPDDAGRVARRINEALQESFQIEGHEVFISVSIGISLFPLDGADAEILMRQADLAMYDAKEKGKNGFQFYREALNQRAQEQLDFETDLRKAVDREEFVLHYQPQINMRDGSIIGAEALSRWKHPVRGMVSPAQFITAIEELGLIIPFTDWVIRQVGKQQSLWHRAGLTPKRVALNVSSKNFLQQRLTGKIGDVLQTWNLSAGGLELELTESVLAQQDSETLAVLAELKKMGLTISIDDFGTGYSSLSYLKTFPIDVVKIDRFFIKDILTSDQDALIVRAIIAMSHSMGMKVVAEGIEEQAQFALLQEMGCDIGQGYLFSPAVPAEIFGQMLRDDVYLAPALPPCSQALPRPQSL